MLKSPEDLSVQAWTTARMGMLPLDKFIFWVGFFWQNRFPFRMGNGCNDRVLYISFIGTAITDKSQGTMSGCPGWTAPRMSFIHHLVTKTALRKRGPFIPQTNGHSVNPESFWFQVNGKTLFLTPFGVCLFPKQNIYFPEPLSNLLLNFSIQIWWLESWLPVI